MDDDPASAPAGWHPDPERPTALLRYWDGMRWTGHTSLRPAPPPPPEGARIPHLRRLPLAARWGLLSLALQGALGLCVLAGIVQTLTERWALGAVAHAHRDLLAGRSEAAYRAADRTDLMSSAVALGLLVTLLLAGVLFLVWLHQAYVSDRLAPSAVRFGQTWAIGGWFCPILNLFRPLQVVNDVRSGSRLAAGRPSSSTAAVLTGTWWTLWLCTNVMSGVAGGVAPARGGQSVALGEILTGRSVHEVLLSAHGVLFAVAALLALLVVRSTSRAVLAVDPWRAPSAGRPEFTLP